MDDLSGNTSQLPYQFLHMLPCTCFRWPRSRLYRYSTEAVWTKGMGRRYGYLHSQSLHTDHPVLPAFGLEPGDAVNRDRRDGRLPQADRQIAASTGTRKSRSKAIRSFG